MDDMSLQVNIGTVGSVCGQLKFAFVVHSSGVAHLQIYASDPSDGRKAGVLLTLDEEGYSDLKTLLQRTDETISRLRAIGQVQGDLAVRY